MNRRRVRGQYAIPAKRGGARQTDCAPFILERLKSARAVRYARIPRIRRRLTGTGPGRGCRRAGMPGRVCGGNEGVDISAREL